MTVRCPRHVQMPMRPAEPTTLTVLVSALVRACSHLLTCDALLACALAGCAAGGCANNPTSASTMRWERLAIAPGRGRDRPPPSASTTSSQTSTSCTAAGSTIAAWQQLAADGAWQRRFDARVVLVGMWPCSMTAVDGMPRAQLWKCAWSERQELEVSVNTFARVS